MNNKEVMMEQKNPARLLENPADWVVQVPSGTESGGMLFLEVADGYASKYFSLATENGNGAPREYLCFSLNASDKGKSPHGSGVRVELQHKRTWTLTGAHSLSLIFKTASTDFDRARYTVAQFLQICQEKDSPLCRIEVEGGHLRAKIRNFCLDGITVAENLAESGNRTDAVNTSVDGTNTTGENSLASGTTIASTPASAAQKITSLHDYDLGIIRQNQETALRLETDGRTLRVFRDGKIRCTHRFPEQVSSTQQNYFKTGLYYQNNDSPDIFTQVFVRELEICGAG